MLQVSGFSQERSPSTVVPPDRGVLGAGTLRLYLCLFLRPREASDVLRLFVPCVFCASSILVFLLKYDQIIKYTAGTDADSTARNILLHYYHMSVHEFGTGPRCSARQKLKQLLSRPADASATSKTHGVGGCCASIQDCEDPVCSGWDKKKKKTTTTTTAIATRMPQGRESSVLIGFNP